MLSTVSQSFDVVVLGARIAGCTVAALLADRGFSVALIDRVKLPSSTLSTHFFRGGGLVGVLGTLRVLDDVLALGPPRLTCQWNYAPGSEPVLGGPQLPGEAGYCLSVRRQPLDAVLLRRALAAGVELLAPAHVTSLDRSGSTMQVSLETGRGPRELDARLVVGADGRRSFVAKAVQAVEEESEPGHRALYYTYVHGWRAPDGSENVDAAEFSLLGDEIAYVFPSDDGVTCVAASVNRPTFRWMKADLSARFRERLLAHEAFAGRLRASDGDGKVWGGAPERNVVRNAAGPGWALVGDAGQHQDPWTGVGMDLASTHGVALARHYGAWLAGEASEEKAAAQYQAERDASRDTWRAAVVGSRDLSAL